MRKAFIVFFALLAASGLCLAQSERGTITGVISDVSEGRLPGAAVTATNVATGTASPPFITEATGEYTIPNLVPGQYRVEVVATGFRRQTTTVTLTAGGTARLDAQLQLGELSETVEVVAEAIQLQTENSKVSASVDNAMIDQLPLVVGGAMRSVMDLVSVVAEAKGDGGVSSLGGGQAGAWGVTLDGTRVQSNRQASSSENSFFTPSLEALTEFAVDTGGFKAEYGQAGGGMISFASKSGTNEFHGSVYDFLRNDILDARGFFATERGVYKQNNFGFSAGGPVYIPGLFDGRNQAFFFFTYEGFRNRVSNNGAILSLPTSEMWDGDFSNLVNNKNQKLIIYDPATTRPNPSGSGYIRDPFLNNRIPVERFSTIAKKMIAIARPLLAPNRGGTPGTYGYINNNYIVTSGSTVSPSDKISLKFDYNIGTAHRLAFFYNRTEYLTKPGPSGPAGLPVPLYGSNQTDNHSRIYRVTEDWVITPKAVAHITFGVNRYQNNDHSPNTDREWKNVVCLPGAFDCNENMLRTSFSEFAGWGGSSFNGTEQPSWMGMGDLTWIRGSHNLKFGFGYDHQEAIGFGQQSIAGSVGFSYKETGVPNITSQTSGSSFASFLLGAADSGSTETRRRVSQVYAYYSMYGQDDWRINDKLTVNLGVRYEFTSPPTTPNDQYSDFAPTKPNPAVNGYPGALVFAGTGAGREGTRSLIPGWYTGISPRFGLAYRASAKTVIRAAAAKTFNRVTPSGSSAHYAGFIGNYSFPSPDNGITPAFYMDQGLPPYNLPPMIDPAFANNQNVDWWNGAEAMRAGESYNWTLSIQRQLAQRFVLEATYNATVGAHLNASLQTPNQVPMSKVDELIARLGGPATVSLLNSSITSPAAIAAGIPIPYANFTNPAIQTSRTVGQALRPYPQYLAVRLAAGGGDKSGHSSYHALVLKLNKSMSGGLSMQWSYSLSKILTDSDSYSGSGGAQDTANRRVEKSIGANDQTHTVKLNTIIDLPFGKGRRWLTSGFLSPIFGGWRISLIQSYASGQPVSVSRNAPLNISNGSNRPLVTTYDNWQPEYQGGRFDPNRDKSLDISMFPAQPVAALGNMTRFNPKLRGMMYITENVSIGKTFNVSEEVRFDFRAEAFNVPNRTAFGTGTTNLSSNNFGVVTSQRNTPRQMQFALKLYW